MPVIKPHDKNRVLEWFKLAHNYALPHLNLQAVTSVHLTEYRADSFVAGATGRLPRVTIVLRGKGKADGKPSAVIWYDKSIDAPKPMRDLDAFWQMISDYFSNDAVDFSDLRNLVDEQRQLRPLEALHNAVYLAIRQAILQHQRTIDLQPVYFCFNCHKDDPHQYGASDDMQEQIENALRRQGFGVDGHIVHLTELSQVL